MTAIALGQGPEFDRIRAIARALGPDAAALGNDVAYVELDGRLLVLSTDASLEDVHFRRAWLSAEEIGWRAAAAALSDLAAAGATALGILVALTVPASLGTDEVAALMRGAGAAARAAGGLVLGGDLSAGRAVGLAVTVVGTAPRAVGRASARPGDALWVSGRLGGARAALRSWEQGRTPEPGAREAFAHPEPRLEQGRRLLGLGATAMMDVSDGLAGDARHLAAASGVAITIDLEQLPRHPAVEAAARAEGQAPEVFAAEGGEDYELLAALPPGTDPGPGFTRIAVAAEGRGVTLRLGGRAVELAGYDHFA